MFSKVRTRVFGQGRGKLDGAAKITARFGLMNDRILASDGRAYIVQVGWPKKIVWYNVFDALISNFEWWFQYRKVSEEARLQWRDLLWLHFIPMPLDDVRASENSLG